MKKEIPRMRLRVFRLISVHLQVVGWIVTLLVVLSPRWGTNPGDFYLGYPLRFYITQYDVAFSHVRVPELLCELAVIGLPVFALIFLVRFVLSRFTRNRLRTRSDDDFLPPTKSAGSP